ncbi:hypothetical protein CGMCC3_g15560 [Colletotrichum fructicola]|nr:uncharacterized protein CGMCC3_g15560 [Colletotrichum fructicola]KAE9568335.1 hypothetical protein CGMCC3_g15560 [Colletotrichum fructicola]
MAQTSANIPKNSGEAILAADETTDDAVSVLGSISSSSASVSSSILDYRTENGRTYHRYKDGKYSYPNDETESDRLEMQHNLFLVTYDNKLGTAPPNDTSLGVEVKRVLDVGTGTGVWAVEFGDEHPEAEVLGVDLSAIQPDFLRLTISKNPGHSPSQMLRRPGPQIWGIDVFMLIGPYILFGDGSLRWKKLEELGLEKLFTRVVARMAVTRSPKSPKSPQKSAGSSPAAASPAHVAPETDGLIVADDTIDDGASSIGSLASSTTSVSGSILDYRLENGRTYHRYKDGKYNYPNDDRENERLDLQHHMFLLTHDNKLGTAPPNEKGAQVKRALDVGTGTGLWAIEFGDEHPEAEVIGVDLSAVQVDFVPPNVSATMA